jgi:hypothetical protein
MYEAIKWPKDMAPSRSPIHFTNRLAARIFQAMASPTGDHAAQVHMCPALARPKQL